MDIDAIQTTIGTWTKAVLGLPVAWENNPAQIQPKLPARVVLSGPQNIERVGEDYVQYPNVTNHLAQPTVVGHREFDVMVRVISRSQKGNEQANFYLEKLRAALKRPTTIETFLEAGIAVHTMGTSTSYDAPFEARWESIASATLRVAAVIADADDPQIPTLTKVSLSSTIEGESGSVLPSPPNLTDVLISAD